MEAVRAGGELTVLDYLRPVWRFKVVVVVVVALAAAATYVYANRETKVYQASTQLYVGPSSLQQLLSTTNIAPTDRGIADQALLATTPAVAAAVRKLLKLPYSTDTLLTAVQAVPDSTADFLTITAKNTDAQLAARLANGFAQAYLQLRLANVVNSARTALQSAQSQLRKTRGGNANASVRDALRQQISTLEGLIVNSPSQGQQLSQAAVPSTAVSPKPTRDAIFAGALALVLGLIVSYLFDRGDRRVRRLSELEALFELPVLATVPHVRHAEPPPKDPYGTPVGLGEPHRTLRVNLDIARATANAKVIMVTSALPSEGKTTIVRNLAISYREAGAAVAVVEADLRRPVLAAQLGVDHGPGLGDALASGGELRVQQAPDGASQPDDANGKIGVAVAGAVPADPTVLLTDGHLRSLMSRLAADYDIVLIDSPPLLPVSDGLPLLGLVDGVLLVARAGTTTRLAAARLRRTIDRVSEIRRVHLLGLIANDVADELASEYALYGKASGDGRVATKTPTPDRAADPPVTSEVPR